MIPFAGTVRFILGHPLSRGRRLANLTRYLCWQAGARLVPGPVAVEFVNGARLLAAPGLTGATGNVYVGLHEFEEMAFLLHALRPSDLFVDVGANIGSYTVLAAAGAGCRAIAFEPVPETFAWLERNIALNAIGGRAEARREAVGARSGHLAMTRDLDTVNHVAPGGASGGRAGRPDLACLDVPAVTLDGALAGRNAFFLKIDVEGYETAVLDGAERTLASPALCGVLLELTGCGGRYGYDEDALRKRMTARGFASYRYDPFTRRLSPRPPEGNGAGGPANTLFLRGTGTVRERLATAPAFTVHGRAI